ncbi:MAG TPA: PH domain-containing protein [Anaerolineales bacterium]|nr:PH domain-containing protein [Anaerolineales bacterium]HNQ94120.1 PH domain-containing protein [Anaerolineales bacterium]HNS59717.1 PH domain-containing protein [Anaerolineales bacterium]
MSYVKENLLPNEKILFTAKVNPAIALPLAFAVFFTCVLLGLLWYWISRMQPDPVSGTFMKSFYTIIFSFFTILLSFAMIGAIIRTMISLFTTEFAVTNRRVIAKTGLIKRRSLELFLEKVESINIRQDLMGRIFNFGIVTVTGTGGTKESFRGIVDPLAIRKKINQVIETYIRQQKPQ